MSQTLTSSQDTIVAFRPNALRTRPPIAGEARGAILFFTGVRYERPQASSASLRVGPGRRGRPDEA